ncbi:hypothetical protein LINPERHAP1_LOCUS20941 [Linum perenne]
MLFVLLHLLTGGSACSLWHLAIEILLMGQLLVLCSLLV